MNSDEYQSLYELESTYWWHVGRLHLLRSLLESWLPSRDDLKILDFGCGTGSSLEVLRKYGRVTGTDASEEALDYCRRRGAAIEDVTLQTVPKEGRLPFDDDTFDVVTALDVLEHLDDDRAGLVELRRVLAPGGLLVVFVPAYRFLWSEHDEALEHRRRYVASDLHSRLNQAKFRVLKRTYAISFSFPLVMGYRLLRGLFPSRDGSRTSYVMLPGFINQLFVGLLRIEAWLVRFINLPIGTSIAAVARKDPEP